jgi:FkbM family methyltransferase
MLVALLFKLNHLTFWARDVEVWGNRVTATSLDRLVNLYLHRLGVRGQEEKRYLEFHIRPGMRVLDIGANQGMYTLLISRIVGRDGCVHAFEPDARLFASLRKNCEGNGAANIKLHNVALGRAAGVTKFYRSKVHSGDNRLARSRHPEWFEEIDVQVAPLDAILTGERVDFIKIDVQGWEREVFKGMDRVFRENPKLQIYFEFWPLGLRNANCEPAQLLNELKSRSFSLWEGAETGKRQVTDFEAFSSGIRGARYTNLLAVRGE